MMLLQSSSTGSSVCVGCIVDTWYYVLVQLTSLLRWQETHSFYDSGTFLNGNFYGVFYVSIHKEIERSLCIYVSMYISHKFVNLCTKNLCICAFKICEFMDLCIWERSNIVIKYRFTRYLILSLPQHSVLIGLDYTKLP